MPHVIHYILWFSVHSNCFRSHYEEKMVAFPGAAQYDLRVPNLENRTKIKTFILTNTTYTRKSDTVFLIS